MTDETCLGALMCDSSGGNLARLCLFTENLQEVKTAGMVMNLQSLGSHGNGTLAGRPKPMFRRG